MMGVFRHTGLPKTKFILALCQLNPWVKDVSLS